MPGPPASTRPSAAASFSAVLRETIAGSGLSLHAISRLLAERGIKISAATLSYWQNGTSRPHRRDSVRAIAELEPMLGVPCGTLLRLLGGPGTLDRRDATSPTHALWPEPATVDHLLAELGPHAQQVNLAVSTLYIHTFHRVGTAGQPDKTYIRKVVRAHADRIDRIIAVMHSAPTPSTLTTHPSCRPGRHRTDPATGYTITELLLDRVMQQGDTAVVEYEWTCPAVPADTDRRTCLHRAADALVIEVEFPPTALPIACTGFYASRRGEPDQTLGPLWVGSTHRAHLAVAEAAPGMYGVRWLPTPT